MKLFLTILLLPLFLLAGEADSAEQWAPKPPLSAGLSLLVPGAGQIYNRNYWKAPIVIALEGYTIWTAVEANGRMQSAEELGQTLPEGSAEFESAKSDWQRARENRNLHIWLFVGAVFLSTLDAYVDAHLYNWTSEMATPVISEAHTIHINPVFSTTGDIGISLTMSFNAP
ncbi:MAG: DUF5683 domain-containing protein [bacterium]